MRQSSDSYFGLIPRELIGYVQIFEKHMEWITIVKNYETWLTRHNLQIVENKLDCSDNQLSTLPSLDGLTKLQILYCSNNRLNVLPSLDGLTNLQILVCYNNQLNVLPNLDELTNLRELHCSKNQLSTLPNLDCLTN